MAEATFSVEAVLQSITADGFFCVDDPEVGRDISEMKAANVQFKVSFSSHTIPGLDFYKRRVLQDSRVRSTIESYFQRCFLGDYRPLWPDYPNTIQQLRQGGANADILLVQLWEAGSEAVFYPGSHTKGLKSIRGSSRIFEIPRAMMERAGIKGIPKFFRDGAIVIMDARLAFQSKQGRYILFAFTTKEQLLNPNSKWPTLRRPENAELETDVQTDKIGVFFDAAILS